MVWYPHRDLVSELDGLIERQAIHVTIQLEVLRMLLDVAEAARSVIAEPNKPEALAALEGHLARLRPKNSAGSLPVLDRSD
jgi:hypothetical protein